MVGPSKTTTKLLRQTFGEQFFPRYLEAEISNEFECVSTAFATLQTQKKLRDATDVITYPLIQEKFALLESDLESGSIGNISELISSRNKSEKGVAKISLITIMRFPR